MADEIRTHFHMTATPFTRELLIGRRWHHDQYRTAESELRDTVEDRMSAALIAPAGTGKTFVLRALCDALPEVRYRIHEVKVAGLSKRDFCRHLAKAVGARPAGHTGALVDVLQERCTVLMDTEAIRPVLIVDEAHDLRPEVLALLRILTNFEMDSRLVLSVVLCGQPPLRQMLRHPGLDAVRGRIACYAELRPLTRSETALYLKHRLDVAGGSPDLFSTPSLDAVFECSQGNLRATDRICLGALKMAAAEGVAAVDADHVARARRKVMP